MKQTWDSKTIDTMIERIEQVEYENKTLKRCAHTICDARNKAVKSGYVCTKCGALFAAADHSQQGLNNE